MKEDLYNNIERFNNGEMEPDESAAFRQQMSTDQELAEEVWMHQRLEEELGDAKKIALRETLDELGKSFEPAAPKRVGFAPWLPVIISGAAAAVALYLLVRTPTLQPVPVPQENIVDTPQPNDSIDESLIPKEMPSSADEPDIENPQKRLKFRLADSLINDALEDQLYQTAEGFSFDFQLEEDYVLEPAAEDKAYYIRGVVTGNTVAKDMALVAEIFDAAQFLKRSTLVSEWDPNASIPTIDFQFVFEVPEDNGWYYYQIKTDTGKVLYTGKLGIYRAD